MTGWKLIWNSLRFHWRSHLGTVLGAAIGSAVLIGALIVGDSVRETLKAKAVERTGGNEFLLSTGDRLFPASLAERLARNISSNRFGIFRTNPGLGATVSKDLLHNHTLGRNASLLLPGVVSRQDGSARANRVQVLVGADDTLQTEISTQLNQGRDPGTAIRTNLPGESVFLNRALARHLGASVGDTVIVRFPNPAAFSKEAVGAPKEDQTLVLRVRVAGVLSGVPSENFSPSSGIGEPMNAFLTWSSALGKEGLSPYRTTPANLSSPANLLTIPWVFQEREQTESWLHKKEQEIRTRFNLEPAPIPVRLSSNVSTQMDALNEALTNVWTSADFQAVLTNRSEPIRNIELKTPRIFLDPPVISAALAATPASGNGPPVSVVPILTYMVNLLTSGTNQTPYSMVTAVGPPYTPADMKNDEIVVNQWLADDLHVTPGDAVAVRYFVADSGSQLIERTNSFRVRSIVPLGGIHLGQPG